MRELVFWKDLRNELLNQGSVALAVVLEADRSTPGRKGFKMFVAPDGLLRGSVGGGLIESKVMEECKTNLAKNPQKNYLKEYKLLGNSEDSIGMICNGVQIIGFIILRKRHLDVIDEIINSVESCSEGYIKITENEFGFYKGASDVITFNRKDFIYHERIGIKNKVYIFGGGHVGLALSEVISRLDFYVIVIDNRTDVNTLAENIWADEIIIKDLVECAEDIIEDEYSFIVIVTPGHIQDKDVLRAVLNKKVKYIGMMGSESKVKTLYKELVSEGVNPDYLSGIYSPIGLKIKSETPEEIAISIAAEIIKIKNSKQD